MTAPYRLWDDYTRFHVAAIHSRDIDQMHTQLANAEQTPLHAAAWKARADTIPHPYLGELGGWGGVDRARKRLYRDTGTIALRETA